MNDLTIFAVREALDRVDGDSELLGELGGIFFGEFESNVSNLRKALEDGDPQAFGRIAHSVKGAAGNIGAVRVAEIAFQLEQRGGGATLSGAETGIDALVEAAREFRAEFESLRERKFRH